MNRFITNLLTQGNPDLMDAETIPTAPVDPNAPAPAPTPEPTPAPAPAPAPVPADADLIAAEDRAGADLAAAQETARTAGKAVLDATAAEASARAALGARVNEKGGMVVLDGSQTARVLLPDGNGAYHPLNLPTVSVTK